ncbi:hypothetical protein LCGC14_1219070 [marine sediment metagenome]|uniref:Uncharacterized protein n=1 Tax=marine sediment metagenome TaxID=412755 RepID=A0A0F9PGF1_9ZZZZ
MAIFKPNATNIQNQMFQDELQLNRDQQTLSMEDPKDEMIAVERAERNEDLTRWQQDLETEARNVAYRLRRWDFDDEAKEWKPMLIPTGKFRDVKTGKTDTEGKQIIVTKEIHIRERPMMNELGINYFLSSIMPSLSRNLMMSNYDEDRIFTRLRGIVRIFIHHLAYHYRDYEIEPGDLSAIVRIFKDTIEPAHWRALNNGERSYLNTIAKRVEAHTFGPQIQKPKSFLQGLIQG